MILHNYFIFFYQLLFYTINIHRLFVYLIRFEKKIKRGTLCSLVLRIKNKAILYLLRKIINFIIISFLIKNIFFKIIIY